MKLLPAIAARGVDGFIYPMCRRIPATDTGESDGKNL
jgi:hypothetical protein